MYFANLDIIFESVLQLDHTIIFKGAVQWNLYFEKVDEREFKFKFKFKFKLRFKFKWSNILGLTALYRVHRTTN